MNNPVNFDYAATTPVDSSVISDMIPYFSLDYGNPSSIHSLGQKAEIALEAARSTCANLINTKQNNIIFTSCGTESDNLALRGCALYQRKQSGANEILTTPVDHHAVTKTAQQLQDEYGFELVYLPVDQFGMIDPSEVKKRVSKKTALVSVIYGNNEVGTINPIADIGRICHELEVPFHSDAVQAAAHLPMDMKRDNLNLISVGAHKMYGPKGVGVLGLNKLPGLLPSQTGGGQEFNFRAGTQNIPLIIGMAKAFTLAQEDIDKRNNELISLRDQLISVILEQIPDSYLTGHPTLRLPNHASFVFSGIDGNRLLIYLDSKGFACSSGSACKVGSSKPSDVLLSMGLTPELAIGSLRITLGRETTTDQINSLISALVLSVKQLRQ